MQTEIIIAQNIKCEGCVNTIRTGLLELPSVTAVTVEIQTGKVTVEGPSLSRTELNAKLAALGYPEK